MAKSQTKRTNKASAQPLVATIKESDALAHFTARAHTWHRESIAVVSSAAVCLIVGLHASIEYDVTIEKLKAAVAERGIKEAQIFKYVGLARALVNHISGKFKVGGPMIDVLKADNAEAAMDVLRTYLSKQKVDSLDDLGVLVGKYQRTASKRAPKTAPRGRRPAAAPPPGQRVGQLPADAPGVQHQAPAAGPTITTAQRPMDVVIFAERSGMPPMELAIAAIGLIDNLDDIGALVRMLTARAEHITHGPGTVVVQPPAQQAPPQRKAA